MAIRKMPEDTNTFTFYNANPKNKKVNDGIVRAVSVVTQKSWERVYQDLFDIGMEMSRPPEDARVVSKYLEDLDFTPVCQPLKADGTKYLITEFCSEVQKGWMLDEERLLDYDIYCRIGKRRATAIIRGRVTDVQDCADKKVGRMYVKLRK